MRVARRIFPIVLTVANCCCLLTNSSSSWAEEKIQNIDAHVIETLGTKGAKGVPELIYIMKHGTETQVTYASVVLGKMGGEARIAIPELATFVLTDDGFTGVAAAHALGMINPDGVPQLVKILDTAPTSAVKQRVAFGLGATEGELQSIAASRLGDLLRDQSEDVRQQAAFSLRGLGVAAIATIRKAIRDPDPSVREFGMQAAGSPAYAELVPDLKELLQKTGDDNEVNAAASALGQMGVGARPSLLRLADAGASSPEARSAVATIAEALADHGDTDALPELRATDRRLKELLIGTDNDSQRLTNAIGRLEDVQTRRQAQYAAGVLGIVLSVALTLIASWRLRRWLRVFLGQRWKFELGDCDYVARVTRDGMSCRITIIPRMTARAAVFEDKIESPECPMLPQRLEALRNQIGNNVIIRVEVDRIEFGFPWSTLIAGSWTDNTLNNVAGQVCLTSEAQFSSTSPQVRNIIFRGLAVPKASPHLRFLTMAAPEVAAVAVRFRKWGAGAETIFNEAGREQFIKALLEADIVHVAAHASNDRLWLADGPFTSQDLAALNLTNYRCRILILSACEAGDMKSPAGLLWNFVLSGINVIAASQPTNDYICRVFFEEFYAALLPKHKAVGVSLADAIRISVAKSRKRISLLPDFAALQSKSFDDTVGSFMLFGDPSLSLGLRYSSRGQ
jgi:HEAT repeat protein